MVLGLWSSDCGPQTVVLEMVEMVMIMIMVIMMIMVMIMIMVEMVLTVSHSSSGDLPLEGDMLGLF